MSFEKKRVSVEQSLDILVNEFEDALLRYAENFPGQLRVYVTSENVNFEWKERRTKNFEMLLYLAAYLIDWRDSRGSTVFPPEMVVRCVYKAPSKGFVDQAIQISKKVPRGPLIGLPK